MDKRLSVASQPKAEECFSYKRSVSNIYLWLPEKVAITNNRKIDLYCTDLVHVQNCTEWICTVKSVQTDNLYS